MIGKIIIFLIGLVLGFIVGTLLGLQLIELLLEAIFT